MNSPVPVLSKMQGDALTLSQRGGFVTHSSGSVDISRLSREGGNLGTSRQRERNRLIAPLDSRLRGKDEMEYAESSHIANVNTA